MALLLKTIVRGVTYCHYDLSDRRTDDFWLVNTPIPILGILGMYYYFVTDFGPKFMKDRDPFNLKKVLIVFNIGQILLNGFIFIEGLAVLRRLDYRCSPVDYTNDKFATFVLKLTWLYMVSKLLDLLDTIFFVLRKKDKQISFLHLYHHIMMCFVSAIGVRYVGGGHSCYVGVLNSFVHVCMYSYYLLAAYDSRYQKNIWWKKYITILQIVQFFLLFVIYSIPVFHSNCLYPAPLIWVLIPQNFLMVILFTKFYYTSYIKLKSN